MRVILVTCNNAVKQLLSGAQRCIHLLGLLLVSALLGRILTRGSYFPAAAGSCRCAVAARASSTAMHVPAATAVACEREHLDSIVVF